MMRLFGSLLASSKASKRPFPVLQRSLAANLDTTKHSYQPRFFSAQASPIPDEDFKFSSAHAGVNGVKEKKSTTRIHVMSTQHVKPDKPTTHELREYKLSALDQIHSPTYVPFVFFYANNVNGNTDVNIDNLVAERAKLLRDSLSETLTRFYPFARKQIDDNHIECNDKGVYYFSMIQVNFVRCGGVAISMSNSHKLIDGTTYMTFLKAWASIANDNNPQEMMVYPNFDSPSLFRANTKPPLFPLSFMAIWPMIFNKGKCSTKRFRFDASALRALKTKASSTTSSTRVVAVTSELIWKCATTAARTLRPSILRVAANIRGRLAPPLPQNAIGNIMWNAVARCESNGGLKLDTMVRHVKAGLAKVDTSFVEQFKGEQGSHNIIEETKRLGGQISNYDADYYSSTSMCSRSGLYEADFGWGRPVWSCFGHLSDDVPIYANAIALMDTNDGGIEAWVTLSQEDMHLLEHDPDLLLYASVDPSPL